MLNLQNQQAMEEREKYLAEVSRRLAGRVSALEAYEALQEMRVHLDATAAAYVELGADPHPAMLEALERFGAAEQIGNAYAGVAPQQVRLGAGAGFALTLLGAALMACFWMIGTDIWFQVTYHMRSSYGVSTLIGAGTGLFVGVWAWVTTQKPAGFGITLCVILNAFLGLTLYRTYVELNRSGTNWAVGIFFSTGLFLIGFASVKLGRYLKKHLPYDLQLPTWTPSRD